MFTSKNRVAAAVGALALLFLSVAALASFATAATAGAPKVSGVWARTSTEMMGAAYLTIQGTGTADKLIAAAAPKSLVKTTELHKTVMGSGGMMSMKPVRSIAPGFRNRQAQARRLPRDADRSQEASGRGRDLSAHAHVRHSGQEDGYRGGSQGLRCGAGRSYSWLSRCPPAWPWSLAASVSRLLPPPPKDREQSRWQQPGRTGPT